MSDRITPAFGYPSINSIPDHNGDTDSHAIAYTDTNPYAEPHVVAIAIANATAVPGTYADTNTPAVVNADAYTNSYCDGDRDCHAKAYA
jgi:hypothetical protein